MDLNLIKELREMTGAGMLDCKKALEESKGDIKKAIDYLREKGITKAINKSHRIAAEGLVNVQSKDNVAVIVEINSETDFVAKNEEFKDLIEKITEILLTNKVETVEETLKLKYETETVNDFIVSKIAKIGEKISFRRFIRIEKTDEETFGTYLHSNDKIASLVILTKTETEVAKNIAMHVTASKPKYITMDEVSQEDKDREREIQTQLAINEGKPENMIEKIVEGKLNKYFKDLCLEEQAYVKEPDLTIKTYLKNNNTIAKTMVRYEVGEGLEKRQDNFKEEVESQMKQE